MKIKELGQSLAAQVSSLADRILDRIPEEKRRVVLLCTGCVVFIAICLTVAALATAGSRTPANPRGMAAGPGIPAEELFYPAEPDFLPPLILERNPHQPWTIEDLELYWQDPKAGNEDKWKEAAKAIVDRLLEGVP